MLANFGLHHDKLLNIDNPQLGEMDGVDDVDNVHIRTYTVVPELGKKGASMI